MRDSVKVLQYNGRKRKLSQAGERDALLPAHLPINLKTKEVVNVNYSSPTIQDGDIALIVSAQNKRYMVRITSGQTLQTHRGVIRYDDLIGLLWGSKILSHLGSPYILLQPSLADILLEIRRNTQIIYPKEVGYILVNMGIGPGKVVLEAGTGSGSLTSALAFSVGPTGKVVSYEARPQMQSLAQKNLERIGLADRVTFKLQDIQEGFDEQNVDALFLDVPNPYDYIPQARKALKLGGFFGSILPTTNQVSQLIVALHRENFAFIEVCEIMLRFYKIAPARLRPTDRMVAHTGYLIFARPVLEAVPGIGSPDAGFTLEGSDEIPADVPG